MEPVGVMHETEEYAGGVNRKSSAISIKSSLKEGMK
jgi:hypothetical protein